MSARSLSGKREVRGSVTAYAPVFDGPVGEVLPAGDVGAPRVGGPVRASAFASDSRSISDNVEYARLDVSEGRRPLRGNGVRFSSGPHGLPSASELLDTRVIAVRR